MGKDGLEGVDILLDPLAASDGGELEAREGAAPATEVPARDEVARRRLVVYLSGRRERKVELGGEVEVEVEVFFRVSCRVGLRWIGEDRAGRYHQQGQRLRATRREALLSAVGDMVRRHPGDGV